MEALQQGIAATGSAASRVLRAARAVSGQADELAAEIGRFVEAVQAA